MPAERATLPLTSTAPPSTAESPQVVPLLVDIHGLVELLSRSRASLARDDSAGRLPAALRIGGSKLWRRAEIVAWVEAGCPYRREWEVMQRVQAGRGR